MKRLLVILTAIIMLSLTTSAEKHYYGSKVYSMANTSLGEPSPASASPFACTCTCGKGCDGSCSSYFAGCGLVDGLTCILECCSNAPAPGAGECLY